MKKMMFGSYGCEVSVVDNFVFEAPSSYEYGRDAVAYAIERFFVQTERFGRACAKTSWLIRLEKGKDRRKQRFAYVFPAPWADLPGNWVRIRGEVDAVGVKVRKVEILERHKRMERLFADSI